MCGVGENVGLSDLNVTGSGPSLATRDRRCVLANSPNNLNLLPWLLIY